MRKGDEKNDFKPKSWLYQISAVHTANAIATRYHGMHLKAFELYEKRKQPLKNRIAEMEGYHLKKYERTL